MKRTYKILSSILVALMIVAMSLSSFAEVSIDKIKPIGTGADDSMVKVGSVIISYVTSAAMVIAVVMVAILGLKYMLGSAAEKSEYKKTLIPLVVGAAFVFGAGAIGKIIVGLASSFNS